MQAPEFSVPIEIAQISPGGGSYDIAVPEDARARIAQRLGILSVDRLEAKLAVKPMAGGIVHVSGKITAAVVQSCVVSLAPVPATIDEDIDIRFRDEDPAEAREGARPSRARDTAEDVDIDADDPPEVAPGGRIDLGELAVTQLALALNPYPRAPGVSFDPAQWIPPAAQEGSNPFAALAGLKKTKQS
jgi:uncharacterized metal-binding protein YceD (DUF177 family)